MLDAMPLLYNMGTLGAMGAQHPTAGHLHKILHFNRVLSGGFVLFSETVSCYTAQTQNSPVSASPEPGLQACATTPSFYEVLMYIKFEKHSDILWKVLRPYELVHFLFL
jgi:hypothetical protein